MEPIAGAVRKSFGLKTSRLLAPGFDPAGEGDSPFLLRLRHHLKPLRLRAFRGDREIARDRLFSELEWVWLARLPSREHLDLRNRVIEFRVIREQDSRVRGCSRGSHLLLGFDVS